MGHIIILPETTKDPISLIGRRAGYCYGANVEDPKKNYDRGLDCIESNHGRTLEYVNVEMVLKGYSARVIREWYTHIGGAPSRLQASTRYIKYKKFDYYIPDSIAKNEEALSVYSNIMALIADAKCTLEDLKIPREDSANVLPLGMTTNMVDKRNLRNLIDMSRQRMCTRAYSEFRVLFNDIIAALKGYSEEWAALIPMVMMPKCEYLGYCPEKKSCGRMPKKQAGADNSAVVIKVNPNKEFVNKMREEIKENDGYCPCSTVKSEDTKCMCKDFIENTESGPCHCGLYIKTS